MEEPIYELRKHSEDVLLINVFTRISSISAASYRRLFKLWLLNPQVIHVFDFSGVRELPLPLVSQFINYGKTLIENQKRWGCLNLNSQVKEQLARENLLEPLRVADCIEDIIGDWSHRPIQRKDKSWSEIFFAVLSDAVLQTFEVQFSVALEKQNPLVRELKNKKLFKPEVGSSVLIEGPGFMLNVVMAFDSENAKACFEKITGLDRVDCDDGGEDMTRELLNMVYGLVKEEVNRGEIEIESAIPRKVNAATFRKDFKVAKKNVVFPFVHESFEFAIEILISEMGG